MPAYGALIVNGSWHGPKPSPSLQAGGAQAGFRPNQATN
jgi:hypothetical protein